MGTTRLAFSKDSVATWASFGSDTPISPVGLDYAKARRAFYVWQFTCTFVDDSVPADGIFRLAFDYLAP